MKRFTRLRRFFSLELSTTFRQPSIELMVSLLLALTGVGMFEQALSGHGMWLAPFNATDEAIAILLGVIPLYGVISLVTGMNYCYYTLLIIVPLMSALTVAGSIESGLLVTYLSYPISRRSVLLLRVLFPVIFLSSMCTVCSAMVLEVLLPGITPLSAYLTVWGILFFVVFFFYLLNSLIAILSRRVSVSMIAGVIIGALVPQLIAISDVTIQAILNPLMLVVPVFRGVEDGAVLFDLVSILVVYAAASLILLTVQDVLFRRLEVY